MLAFGSGAVSVKVIVGLGNPGETYAKTPHNMGFLVVDRLARQLGGSLRMSRRFSARLGETRHGEATLLLVEPQTYMNSSGDAVGPVLAYRKLTPSDLLVVVDDADLPLGALRLRKQGSSGGHRGLESITRTLGTGEFGRVRVGIGRGRPGGELIRHVLNAFSSEEWRVAEQAIDDAANAVLCWIEHGADEAMNRYNARKPAPADGQAGTAGGKEL